MPTIKVGQAQAGEISSKQGTSQPKRRSLNLPLAQTGESNGIRRLREENRRILGRSSKNYSLR